VPVTFAPLDLVNVNVTLTPDEGAPPDTTIEVADTVCLAVKVEPPTVRLLARVVVVPDELVTEQLAEAEPEYVPLAAVALTLYVAAAVVVGTVSVSVAVKVCPGLTGREAEDRFPVHPVGWVALTLKAPAGQAEESLFVTEMV
jgi:hypothetical protein